ncbi:MAG: hypothetical protein ACI4IQ_01025 [Eubacterium sp.]
MSDCKNDKLAKQKRIIAFITAIVIAMAMTFSALYVAKSASHTCSNTDCQICHYIDNSLKLFNGMNPDPHDFLISMVLLFTVVLVIGKTSFEKQVCTLVNLKIKLTN